MKTENPTEKNAYILKLTQLKNLLGHKEFNDGMTSYCKKLMNLECIISSEITQS